MPETDLFVPLRDYFENLGYTVHGEVGSCDLVARRGDDLVVVETKMTMSLRLVSQGVRRQQVSDEVYLAVPRTDGGGARRGGYPANFKDLRLLLHRLGLGLLLVGRRGGVVVAVAAAGPAGRRKNKRLKQSLITEIERRRLDAGPSGARRNTPLLTAYRQEALLLAAYLHSHGTSRPRDAAAATSVSKARQILYANHYGWFEHPEPGRYGLSSAGEQAVAEHKDLIQAMSRPPTDSHQTSRRQKDST